jgi:tRNA (uracil-5-)-methyltransferase TRM9
MNLTTIQQLLELNRRFYAEFGPQFSATRQRIQPGVREILSKLDGTEQILDLGCGNGEIAQVLAQSGFHGTYTGLDFSLPLLEDARSITGDFQHSFYTADLTRPGWEGILFPSRFSLITAFAVLHHIPGTNMRQEILQRVHRLLEPAGRFILSNWQFLNSEKLKQRIEPWEKLGKSAAEVEAGDYLLDWRSGGSGLRYVHHFSPQELSQLATETGFVVKESFLSDGSGGRLGLYQVWERNENKR